MQWQLTPRYRTAMVEAMEAMEERHSRRICLPSEREYVCAAVETTSSSSLASGRTLDSINMVGTQGIAPQGMARSLISPIRHGHL